jgi:hypothetical protein
MKQFLFLCMLLLMYVACFAQDPNVSDLKKEASRTIKKAADDTLVKTWKKGGQLSLNVNQGSLSNWSAGGDKFSFSLNAFTNLFAFYKKDKHSWDNSLDLAYGIVNTTSLGSRKSSDRIDFLSKYGYELRPELNLAGLVNFRSQFAEGFTYLKNAAGGDSAELTSETFSPIYLLTRIGLDWKPKDQLSVFVSPITARWVIVQNDALAPLYGVPENKNAKQEFGAFLSANYKTTFKKKFGFKSKLDLFSNYKNNPQNIDIFFSNVLTAQITKYINFSFNVDVIYDDDTQNVNHEKGPAPQILQLMGIGFAYSFNNY